MYLYLVVYYWGTKTGDRKGENKLISFCYIEKIACTHLHKKDSDEAQITLAFEGMVLSLLSLDMMVIKNYQEDEGKVQQIVNRGRPVESKNKASNTSDRLLSLT